ncbi:MAG: hypothetical protein V3R85_09440 [Alphaproteobacteria bacterium]
MKTSVSITFATALAICAGAVSAMPAQADPVADTYKGQTITILVGYGAGGTYGKNSILLARDMSRYIPGHPTMVVQHMPGAGGLKATNYAYNVLPKNGMGILMPPNMIAVSEKLRPKKVKYKTNKFTWLGRVIGSNSTLAVRRDSGIREFADIRTKPLIVASSGTGSPTFLMPALINSMLGTKLKIVKGYKGSRKMQLSMEQGETQGIAIGWTAWYSGRPQWFGTKDSFAIPIIQNGYKREAGLENVPLILDFAKNEEERQIAKFLASASIIGRGLAFPPDVPRHLIEPMRAAFWKTVTNPAFIAEAKRRRLPVAQMTGAEIQKIVNDVMKIKPSVVKTARKMIFG